MRIAIRSTVQALAMVALVASSAFGQVCTIDFEGTCPNSPPECSVTFAGGLGCRIAGLGDCYSSGVRSYEVDANNTLTITAPNGIVEIDVFFANTAGNQGTMTFWDATTGGTMVGTPIQTNGNCAVSMPPTQNQAFSSVVQRIEVDVSGGGSVWIDDLTLTDPTVPVQEQPWTNIKNLYRE
jgi:hypothetical protein